MYNLDADSKMIKIVTQKVRMYSKVSKALILHFSVIQV